MTSVNTRTNNKWTQPETLIGILGLIMVGYTGYSDFQDTTGTDIRTLDVRVARLESDNVQHEKRLDRLAEWMERR
jgi:hemerythrin superfamily protein